MYSSQADVNLPLPCVFKQLKGKIKAVFASKPGETIVHEAKENKVALIVIGCRGNEFTLNRHRYNAMQRH